MNYCFDVSNKKYGVGDTPNILAQISTSEKVDGSTSDMGEGGHNG